MTPSRSLICALTCALVIASAACTDTAPPQQPASEPAAPNKAAAPAPDPVVEAPEALPEQHRTHRGDRNPFDFAPELRPPTEVTSVPSTQDWLAQAKLVGIVSGTITPKAMFVDRNGHGHILTERDLFKDGARVVDIREREVEIALTPTRDEGAQGDIEPTKTKAPETIIVRLHHNELSLATPKHPDSPLY